MANALFFNDKTMHKIYEDEGSFNFIYQIPQIVLSSIISAIINVFIKYLSLSEKDILEIKRERNEEYLKIILNKKLKVIKIKFAMFFIIAFLLLIFFMYYITCFCGVFINTQLHLIKDSLISFGLSLIYPFLIYIIPSSFRICALKTKKKDKKCLYKFSRLLQLL